MDAKVVPDDRERAKHGLPDAALKRRVSAQDEPKHGGGDQEEGKQREKRVVGDDRAQIAPVVLGVLQPDSERKAEHAPAALKAVEPADQVAESHRSSLRRSPAGLENSSAHLLSLAGRVAVEVPPRATHIPQ